MSGFDYDADDPTADFKRKLSRRIAASVALEKRDAASVEGQVSTSRLAPNEVDLLALIEWHQNYGGTQ